MNTTTAKRAYRFRFYPTPEQEQTLRRTLGCCRKVYNMALDARSEAWTVRHRFWFAETPSFRAGRKQTVLLSQIDMI